MARTSILPLPDAAVRHLLANIDELRYEFPVERGTRPFVSAFLRLVHAATGGIYGANIVRKLLQLYAPEYRPSTSTIHDEIKRYRVSIEQKPELAPAVIKLAQSSIPSSLSRPPSAVSQPLPAAPAGIDLGKLNELVAGLERTLKHTVAPKHVTSDSHQYEALARALEAENQRLRAYSDNLVNQLEEARRAQTDILQQYESAKAERDTYQKVSAELTQQLAELSQVVKVADDRTAASHRFALGRIEEATVEVRRQKELLAAEKERTAAVQRRLEEEQNMSMALRQLVNKLKAEASPRGQDE